MKQHPNTAMATSLLGLSREDMNQLVYEKALEWLKATINEDEMGIDALTRTPHFWRWWMNHWECIDRTLMADQSWADCPILSRREQYKAYHSAEMMNVFPGQEVLQDTYAILFGHVNEWHTRQNQAQQATRPEPVHVINPRSKKP